jgi:hypothetical protein
MIDENDEGFRRKWLWPNRGAILEFAVGEGD